MKHDPGIIEEQIAWWKANGYDAADAWDALGCCGVKLLIYWDDVRAAMAPMVKPEKNRKAAA